MVNVDGRELKLTNLDKVLYPQSGWTKAQVIDYYARAADVLIPHLENRPLTLKRYPDGVETKPFFEKKCPSHAPDWVERAEVPSEKGPISFCLCNEPATLVWLGNLADLEFHPLLSHAPELERPTAVAFDLDPGEGVDLIDCCQVAVWIRGLLERFELSSYPKVSGKKGLHLFVPLNGKQTYEQTKPFARGVAEALSGRFPDQVTATMSKAERKGKVFVDWSQNDFHKTTLGVYSLRAVDPPRVSVPIEWSEVEAALESRDLEQLQFSPEDALARVEERGDLFAPVLSERQQLPDLG
jgi:bifunctional non-homologous end joining protein LigD